MLNVRHIDVERLRRDLSAQAHQARALKHVLRSTWTKPMADEQRALAELRRHITRLCILRAHLRGRRHLSSHDHARIAEHVAREYMLPNEPTVSP